MTDAVAVLVDVPFATIELGASPTLTFVAGPGVWVSVACPAKIGQKKLSVAVTVTACAVVELVIVAV